MPTIDPESLSPAARVAALAEALPYVQRLAGQTLVVKYGGAAQVSPELSAAVTEDLVLLTAIGARVVLCHGGGPAVSEMGRRLGLESRFVDGLRVTDEETMRVAQQVQVGLISRDIVAALGRRGGRAVGLSGHDAGGWLRARPRQHRSQQTGEAVDLGRVGDIADVRPGILRGVLDAGMIPVVAPVAVDDDLRSLNVNADSVATAVAVALGAPRLIFLTDVDGIRGPDGDSRARLSAAELASWIDQGIVTGGMIPKARACLQAVDGGVRRVTVADGRVPHALLLELFTDRGVGTLVESA
ncbi:MAG: acetylglutamate kinase [Deltaproteobacteria bacterium]|nr:MAG: acetylglutamate kinase [Deltaproteobacteria bacterium]